MPAERSTHPRFQAYEDSWLPYVAAFMIFSPVGLLIGMIQPRPWSLVPAIALTVFSGCMSLGYIYCFIKIRKRWWALVPLNIAPLVIPQGIFWLIREGQFAVLLVDASDLSRRITMAVLSVVLLSIGFILLIRHLSSVTIRAERHRTEMALAEGIHKNLVPQISFRRDGVEVFGRSEASTEMGGDLIDLVEHNGVIDLSLADISGHGVRAGVLMAMVKSAIRTRLLDQAAASLPLSESVRHLNRLVCDVSEPDMFATFACLRIGPGRRVEYALAGHLPILHISAAGEVRELNNESLPLGIDAGEAFDSRTVEVRAGDLLAVLTDGLVEAQNAQRQQFGMPRVREALAAAASRPLDEVYASVLGAVRAHGERNDDQTLLLARIT